MTMVRFSMIIGGILDAVFFAYSAGVRFVDVF
jgi:hypothetical protein